MALPNAESSTQELLHAQTLIWSHIFNYVNSLSLKCSVQLGIPDIIHKHGKPITLTQLADALSIDKSKSDGLYRLMRILVHSKIFDVDKILGTGQGTDQETYSLTRASRLLMRDEPLSLAPYVATAIHPVMIDPLHHMNEWFHDESPTPFHTKHGRGFWEFGGSHSDWNQVFHDEKQSSQVFEGLNTVVDVGGGTGEVAKAVTGDFPGLKFTVLDLPHVVAGLDDSEDVRFVSGDMLEFIPAADAVFLKSVLHNWGDEDCVKILGKCKEAISGNGGKVIILDIVVDSEKHQRHAATNTQLCFDMLMMALLAGKERTEKEWAHLFSSAGFTNYKIIPLFGLRSIIEVFP